MQRTPIQQARFEADYQILSREVEIEIFESKLGDLRIQIAANTDDGLLLGLHDTVSQVSAAIAGIKSELDYFEHRKEILAWPKWGKA